MREEISVVRILGSSGGSHLLLATLRPSSLVRRIKTNRVRDRQLTGGCSAGRKDDGDQVRGRPKPGHATGGGGGGIAFLLPSSSASSPPA